MSTWCGGAILRNQGISKEPEGKAREARSDEERASVCQRLANKRLRSKIRGKRTYQEKKKKRH
jgi:hypothetical protein